MSELDLIPVRYRRLMALRRGIVRFSVLYVVLLVALAGGRAALSHRIETEQSELDRLHAERRLAEQRRGRLEHLREERQSLSQRLAVLTGLRGGLAAKEMFAVMDRALDEDVWFTSWTFRRAGEVVEKTPETVRTGYFIVVPKQAPDDQERAWRMQTHMEISGQARDHTALARFVRRLSEQSEIQSARILNTRIRSQPTGDVIDFELAMLVRSRL